MKFPTLNDAQKTVLILGTYLVFCTTCTVMLLTGKGCKNVAPGTTIQTQLAPDETEKVIIDPHKHTLTVITPTKIKTMTLPNRPSSVALIKNDGLRIVSPQWGWEASPFLGVGTTIGDTYILAGLDGYYFKRLDFGGGLSVNPHDLLDTRLFISASMFIYSNTSVGVGLDNRKSPILLLKVRF